MTLAHGDALPPGATAATAPTRAGERLSTWRWSSIPGTATMGGTIMMTTSTADTTATTDMTDMTETDPTATRMPKHLRTLLSLTMLWMKKVLGIMSPPDNRNDKQLHLRD